MVNFAGTGESSEVFLTILGAGLDTTAGGGTEILVGAAFKRFLTIFCTSSLPFPPSSDLTLTLFTPLLEGLGAEDIFNFVINCGLLTFFFCHVGRF